MCIHKTFLIRINQLPDYVARWQHVFEIYVATFISYIRLGWKTFSGKTLLYCKKNFNYSNKKFNYIGSCVHIHKMFLIRINQLPDSVARWQHVFEICFETYFVKSHKIADNSATAEAREKVSIDLESLEF